MELFAILWTSVTCICLVFGIVSFPLSSQHYFEFKHDITSHNQAKPTFSAPYVNVWADLGDSEVGQLLHYLHKQNDYLNLTSAGNATAWDNSIISMEALPPPKSAVLPYLDDRSSIPARFAKIIVGHGSGEQATICEWSVGPLPVSEATTISPYTTGHSGGEHCVSNPTPDFPAMAAWWGSAAPEMESLLLDLLGPILSDNGEHHGVADSLVLGGRMLRTQQTKETHKILMWSEVHSKSQAWSLLPQGFYLQLDVTSRNSSKWEVLKCFYNGKLYDSVHDLKVASQESGFVKSEPNYDDGWSDTVDFSVANLHDDEPPAPVMIQLGGPRYKVDEKERFISWKGFEFYISSRPATAMALYDIRFRGKRIMYELGLQEALAAYSGNNPMQSGQNWLDTFFGMGLRMFELVPGYDCPAYATYFATEYSVKEEKWRNPSSVCIFEYTADHPLQRHTTDQYVSISRNTYLVVKSVSTVGNYDYTIEYIFYLDGSIEVKVRASGYIFSAFFDEAARADLGDFGEDEYGYKVQKVVSGSMHDHVLNFKADMDIGGIQNSLVRVDIEPAIKTYPWDNELETPRRTMHLKANLITHEAGLDWPKNSQAMYIVHNNNSRNAWGEKRGYRIAPGTGMGTPPHLTILNSTSLEQATGWAGHDLWALKQKDSEPRSANERNVLNPSQPLVDFSDFVDGEEIVQEDLVIYFNLGAHHVPHAGDIPNTLMHTSASSVMFIPHNFHDRDPTRETAQGVLIELEKGKDNKVRYFGGMHHSGVSTNLTQLEPDLSRYHGEAHGLSTSNLMAKDSWIGMGIAP